MVLSKSPAPTIATRSQWMHEALFRPVVMTVPDKALIGQIYQHTPEYTTNNIMDVTAFSSDDDGFICFLPILMSVGTLHDTTTNSREDFSYLTSPSSCSGRTPRFPLY